jgi:hypothetical protein
MYNTGPLIHPVQTRFVTPFLPARDPGGVDLFFFFFFFLTFFL